ncbi:16S rRNA (cytosine(1402)-N(4))-methyltransferase RsmH, partial [Candidatus Falkowbacteria bacterium]|nr:16S rRNA (cytosine(1402)-N(4))-methyltransferase RsmH [Candidatus Falkowbacteria bacterium]
MAYSHQPVMLDEVIHYLNPLLGDEYIDCTLGGGGHTQAIAKKILPQGKILSLDLDQAAIEATKEKIKNKNVILVQGNFSNLKQIASARKFNAVNGILLDLGLSSGQLQDHARGFSFLAAGKLGMSFSGEDGLDAEQILKHYSQKDLEDIFRNFGEEKLAGQISEKIVKIRREQAVTSPKQLVDIVAEIYKNHYRLKSKINPATKVFQALRIAVNKELDNLEAVLPQAISLLVKGGRLAVISYHSLEDRIVKNFFRQESKDCICPPEMPVCQCGHKKTLKIIT